MGTVVGLWDPDPKSWALVGACALNIFDIIAMGLGEEACKSGFILGSIKLEMTIRHLNGNVNTILCKWIEIERRRSGLEMGDCCLAITDRIESRLP